MAPLVVGSGSDVNATSENENKIVEINHEMIGGETLVHAGSKSAYSWCYHLPSTDQSAEERMGTRTKVHQTPQTLRNLE